MSVALVKALAGSVLVSTLFSFSLIKFVRVRALGSFLQLLGAGCLVIMVVTHVCEVLHLLPWMQWGRERSVGHYLDFSSAALGLTLFLAGYALTKRRAPGPHSSSQR